MTLVKKKGHGMVKLVDDSKVPAMLAQGFELLNPPETLPAEPEASEQPETPAEPEASPGAPPEKPKKGGEKDGKNIN